MFMKRKLHRWILASLLFGLLIGLAAPVADAGCMRCSLGLCISAHYDGADSCQEIVVVVFWPPTYICELSGVCTYEGEGSGGPCTDGCDPEQQY